MVPCDHDDLRKELQTINFSEQATVSYLDSSTPAFSNSIRHSSTRRVLSGEVHLVSIKSKALWELVIRQAKMAKTCIRGKKMFSRPQHAQDGGLTVK
uniref:Uncharacterized protein n=1 Tax=Mastacembelus armatus TaxID=205130 RepID=A0A3Q3MV04_9TELE